MAYNGKGDVKWQKRTASRVFTGASGQEQPGTGGVFYYLTSLGTSADKGWALPWVLEMCMDITPSTPTAPIPK